MSRRGVSPEDDDRWVFNRLAGDYRARPGYPAALVERLAALAGGPGASVAELGAGTGLLSWPLARLGLLVHAVEPARRMLEAIGDPDRDRPLTPALSPGSRRGRGRGLPVPGAVVPVHAAAEETGLPAASFDLVVLADALQWVDPERGGREAARLLAPGAVLAVVTPRLARTPFLDALAGRLAAANPKARPLPPPVGRLFAAAGLAPPEAESFEDELLLEPARLDAILRSLSYAGPALGPAALETLLADARALARVHGGAAWRRELTLEWRTAGRPVTGRPAAGGP